MVRSDSRILIMNADARTALADPVLLEWLEKVGKKKGIDAFLADRPFNIITDIQNTLVDWDNITAEVYHCAVSGL